MDIEVAALDLLPDGQNGLAPCERTCDVWTCKDSCRKTCEHTIW
jgi:hypothetical protein